MIFSVLKQQREKTMTAATVEHANISVENPDQSAELLCRLFDWEVRWTGASLGDGYTVHVGTSDSYLALYSPRTDMKPTGDSYKQVGGLNHIGLVVDDLELIEQRVKHEGLVPHNHGDYEPGKRFYFDTPDGLEVEVVSYA